jgi:hypothetical protein
MTLSLLKANSHTACGAHAVPLPCHAAKGLDCVFTVWFKQCGRVWVTLVIPCRAPTMPFWKRLLKATAQHGMGTERRVWINIGRRETACGRPARVRLLPATTRSSTKVVTRSIPISDSGGQCVKLLDYQFGYFRLPRGLSRRTWRCWSRAGARHGMCELTRHGMGTAYYVWISLENEEAKARYRAVKIQPQWVLTPGKQTNILRTVMIFMLITYKHNYTFLTWLTLRAHCNISLYFYLPLNSSGIPRSLDW